MGRKPRKKNIKSPKVNWKRKILLFLLGLWLISLIPVLFFRYFNPPTTPLMWIRWVESGFQEKYPLTLGSWKRLKDISPQLIRAVIASEDQKFFMHNGFDWEAVSHAIKLNKKSKRTIGASTISMQTARNVFLWQNRDWIRKSMEAYFTTLIELVWSKERILEVYFNIIEWGDGIFGCNAASRKYFNHSPKWVSPIESAWLAAILPNPRVWSQPKFRNLVEKKQFRILGIMGKVSLSHLRK